MFGLGYVEFEDLVRHANKVARLGSQRCRSDEERRVRAKKRFGTHPCRSQGHEVPHTAKEKWGQRQNLGVLNWRCLEKLKQFTLEFALEHCKEQIPIFLLKLNN